MTKCAEPIMMPAPSAGKRRQCCSKKLRDICKIEK